MTVAAVLDVGEAEWWQQNVLYLSRTLSQHLPQPHVHLNSLQNKHLNPEEEAKPPCVKFQSTLLLETESNPPRSRPTILPNLMMYTNHLLMLSIYHFLCCLPHQEYNYNVHLKIVMEIQWM